MVIENERIKKYVKGVKFNLTDVAELADTTKGGDAKFSRTGYTFNGWKDSSGTSYTNK